MKKISIVILNYINYKDTIERIESIFEMNYRYEGIVVVDNNSENESVKILNKKYKDNKKIIIVKARHNYGFAKGNNIGICIARRKFHTDFVFVVNNDTVFVKKDYFKRLLECYSDGIGVLGSEIHLKGNIIQKERFYDISVWGTLYNLLDLYLKKLDKTSWLLLFPENKCKKKVRVLHGCAVLFTPDFFKYYDGFYEKTFLYAEELILYLMCKKYGLRQLYVHDTYIYHKEDQSSQASFQNVPEIIWHYRIQSYKFLLWWTVKDKVNEILSYMKNTKRYGIVYGSTAKL